MADASVKLIRLTTRLSATLGFLVAIAAPLFYLNVSYQYQIASLATEAEINARLVNQIINNNPELWQYEFLRLEELLRRRPAEKQPESRHIYDNRNHLVASVNDGLGDPLIKRSAPLLDSGTKVGRIEIARSLRPQLVAAALVFLLSSLLGFAIFATLRTFPLRALKRTLASLYNEKERAEVTLHAITDAVITTDAAGRIEYMNPVATYLCGVPAEAAKGRSCAEVFKVILESSGEPAEDAVAQVLETHRATSHITGVALLQGEDRMISIEESAAPLRSADNAMIGAVLVFRDVSESRDMALRLTHQASHDALTDLINRHEFELRLKAAIESAGRHEQHTLCYMDLDQFKVVNDTCGHLAGDELLKQIASLIRMTIRSVDTVARLGGDEFGLLLHCCRAAHGQRIAEQVLQTLRDYRFIWAGHSFSIGASIGVVTITHESGGVMDVLRAADAACYAAKDAGRGRLHVFQADDHLLAQRRGEMQWIVRLTEALDQGGFCLFYQPILPLHGATTNKHHFEVLLRMRDAHGTLIPPGAFIPAAERYGLMARVDRWVIEHTFEALQTLFGNDIRHELSSCAINLSGASWSDDKLPEFILTHAEKYAIPAEVIYFEITETAAISNLARAATFIRQLKTKGFRFSLDDFGSGVSSFGYLKQLPVDCLKIDGGFVKNMINDRIDSAMVATINEIGHIMGIETVAEFVESVEILDQVRAMGIDNAQGYAIAKPLPLMSLVSHGQALMEAS